MALMRRCSRQYAPILSGLAYPDASEQSISNPPFPYIIFIWADSFRASLSGKHNRIRMVWVPLFLVPSYPASYWSLACCWGEPSRQSYGPE